MSAHAPPASLVAPRPGESIDLPRPPEGGPPLRAEARRFAEQLLDGTLDAPEAVRRLRAWSRGTPSAEALAGFADALLRRARRFPIPRGDRAYDLCGTGGARVPTYNISTVAAFVVSAGGIRVAKHGNVSSRGLCGSSDLLEALGLPVTRSRAFAEECYRRAGLAFLHAPLYHEALRAIAPVRRAVGGRTIFNLLGPLVNPAPVVGQLVGAATRTYAVRSAAVLSARGCRGWTVHGPEGTDEPSPRRCFETVRLDPDPRRRRRETWDPSELLTTSEREGAWGALPPAESARAALGLLNGQSGARRGSVLLSSGLVFWSADRASGLADGVELARTVLEDGGPARGLRSLRALARERPW